MTQAKALEINYRDGIIAAVRGKDFNEALRLAGVLEGLEWIVNLEFNDD